MTEFRALAGFSLRTGLQVIERAWMQHSVSERPYDLELRLLEFSAQVISITEALSATRAGNHVGGQLLRCATSP
ncbi:MAG: hypothetical protein JSR48_15005 [Verrucomicrobia bacterium]|nr:hypothetical protein [Verrucomicrobiota bacterium]